MTPHAGLSSTNFPSLRHLVQQEMGALARKRPKVVGLLSTYTRMPEAKVRQALTPGNPPSVGITGKEQYEWTLPATGVYIGGLFAAQFENVVKKNKQKSDPDLARAAASAALLMESKLLHGFVHWAWGFTQDPEPPSRRGYRDFAWDFEEDFYGTPMTATALSLLPKYIIIPGWQ